MNESVNNDDDYRARRSTAVETHYGTLATDAPAYRPLDVVTVQIGGRAAGDASARLTACDPEQRRYFEQEVALEGNRAEIRFPCGGALGNHYLYLTWAGEDRYSRYMNFAVDAETTVESDDVDFDMLMPRTRDLMRLGRRDYETPRGRFVGYMSADTWHFDGIWLRDWIYGLPAYRHWETDMQCGLDRFIEAQDASGMVPDGIERDGGTWRVGLESDVEYIFVLGVWQTWQATGDDTWLRRVLPSLEKALNYVRDDARHWDDSHQLVKRQHSCDTWDFDIDGAKDHGDSRHVIATCDQSGYVLAYRAMAAMHAHLGNREKAAEWRQEADATRDRAADLLWDGTKFLHHVHLDSIDHGDFDETTQLAMGNTWAMTRGLASSLQARSIIDEYRRRHEETGDAYPWWSLQPGYPDRLGYFSGEFRRQGGYANGGLMPWVGGELCRAAFRFGRETYAVELLRQYADHLQRTGGAKVWYWPDGEPGFRTTNEVPYAGWGMAEWLHALLEGLAGITDSSVLFETVTLSPRWSATSCKEGRVIARYAASKGYVAYRWSHHADENELRIDLTGSGHHAAFHVLLPDGMTGADVTVDGTAVSCTITREDESTYADFAVPIHGVVGIRITGSDEAPLGKA